VRQFFAADVAALNAQAAQLGVAFVVLEGAK
jgi:hypothetical protein